MPATTVATRKSASRANPRADVQSVELSRPVTSLAESISKSMSALYSLHVALSNAYDDSSPSVVRFVQAKDNIRVHWESFSSFFQRSMGYARDYMTLCQSLQSGDLTQHSAAAAASATISYAQQLRSELTKLRPPYADTVREFASQKYNAPPRRGQSSSLIDLGLYASHGPFAHMSHSATHPTISDVFQASMAALQESLTAIGDVSAFWEDYVAHLAAMSCSGEGIKNLASSGYFRSEIARWKGYHDSLLQATFSISLSCDALSVVPVTQSNNWRRMLERLRPKRRATTSDTDVSRNMDTIINAGYRIENVMYHEVGCKALTNPYDVFVVTQATSTLHACLRTFFARSRVNLIKSRLRVYERLLRQAARYINTLSSVGDIAIAWKRVSRDAQRIIRDQMDTEASASLRDHAFYVSNHIDGIVSEYQAIESALQQEVIRNPVKKRNKAQVPLFNGSDEAKIACFISGLKDRELLAYTKATLGSLMALLTESRSFWSDLVEDINHISAHGPMRALNNQDLSEEWKKQEAGLQKYYDEIERGKALDQTDSKPSFLRRLNSQARRHTRVGQPHGAGISGV